MEKRLIAKSHRCVGGLDDDYNLYEDGTVVHDYDTHHIGGNGYNKRSELRGSELNNNVKQRLLCAAEEANIELTRKLLGL